MTRPLTRRAALPLIGLGALGAPSALRAAGGVPGRRVAALARGFNLPDLVPATAMRPGLPAVLAELRADGFTHIRLPVRAESVIPRFAGPAEMGACLDDLDAALDLLLGRGYAVSVDMHPGGDLGSLFRRDPDGAAAAVAGGWDGLARRLRRRDPDRVFAEILNEPPTDDGAWRPRAEALAAHVRALLPGTTLLAGPAPFERVEALAAWRPFPDRNVAYVCHYYDPMAFTHQGATWEGTGPYRHLSGVPFPGDAQGAAVREALAAQRAAGHADAVEALQDTFAQPWTAARIAAQFAPLGAWSRRHGAPVVLNEFGVLRSAAPRADRLAWTTAVRRAAEAEGIGWTAWDFDEGFALVVDGRPDPGMVDALLGRLPRR